MNRTANPYLIDRASISYGGKQSRINAGRYLHFLRNRHYCACSHYFDRTSLSTSWCKLCVKNTNNL